VLKKGAVGIEEKRTEPGLIEVQRADRRAAPWAIFSEKAEYHLGKGENRSLQREMA